MVGLHTEQSKRDVHQSPGCGAWCCIIAVRIAPDPIIDSSGAKVCCFASFGHTAYAAVHDTSRLVLAPSSQDPASGLHALESCHQVDISAFVVYAVSQALLKFCESWFSRSCSDIPEIHLAQSDWLTRLLNWRRTSLTHLLLSFAVVSLPEAQRASTCPQVCCSSLPSFSRRSPSFLSCRSEVRKPARPFLAACAALPLSAHLFDILTGHKRRKQPPAAASRPSRQDRPGDSTCRPFGLLRNLQAAPRSQNTPAQFPLLLSMPIITSLVLRCMFCRWFVLLSLYFVPGLTSKLSLSCRRRILSAADSMAWTPLVAILALVLLLASPPAAEAARCRRGLKQCELIFPLPPPCSPPACGLPIAASDPAEALFLYE